ncbi:MAG: ATP-binding protein [Gemmatimonadaceae bacterium]
MLSPNYVFRADDLRSRDFDAAGDSVVVGELQRWIVSSLPEALKTYQRSQTYGAITGSIAGRPRVVYFSVRRNSRGEPVAAYGLEPAIGALDSVVFAGAMRETELQRLIVGSGIGLAVVRDVLVRHGGSVRVEDAPGGGARFVLALPDACRLGPRAVQDVAIKGNPPRAAEL